MVQSGVTVTYFGLHARAETARCLLHCAGVEFTNEEISQEAWPEIKNSGRMPFGSMPLITCDGIPMNQSKAAGRALAIKYGFYSTDPKIIHAIDSLFDYDQEISLGKITGYAFDPAKDDTKNDEWVAAWKKKGDLYENRFNGHGKPWIAGTDKPTIADISIASHYLCNVYNDQSAFGALNQRVKDEVLSTQPKLK